MGTPLGARQWITKKSNIMKTSTFVIYYLGKFL